MRTAISILMVTMFYLSGFSDLSSQSDQLNWAHSSGAELLYSSHLSVIDLSLIAAEGSVSSYNSSSEWSFNYRNRFDYHSVLGWISFNALGGRFQYNNVPHFIFGIRGALDNDRFIEAGGNWFERFEEEEPFMRKSGRYGSHMDYGLKGYGDLFFKPLKGITWGFWNSFVLIENNPLSLSLLQGDSIPSGYFSSFGESPQLYFQSTPRIIYELKGYSNRLVAELYMDNRLYLLGDVDLNGLDYSYFFKIAFVPQWIVNWKGDHFAIEKYSAASAEIVQHITYAQLVFKTSPVLSWSFSPLRFGIRGGGFEFRDEIGIIFDNNELLGLKLAGPYFSFIFSPLGFVTIDIFPFLTIGAEAAYRGGLSIADGERFFLEELSLSGYLQSEIAMGEDWRLFLKGGVEYINGTSELDGVDALPGETMIRFSLKLMR